MAVSPFASLIAGSQGSSSPGSFTTASFTPTSGSLMLLGVCLASGSAIGLTPTITDSRGWTWTQVETMPRSGAGDVRIGLLYRCQAPAATAGTVTLTGTVNWSHASWSVVECTGQKQGNNGADALAQVNANPATEVQTTALTDGTGEVRYLCAAVDADSRMVAFSLIGDPGTFNVPTGWTQVNNTAGTLLRVTALDAPSTKLDYNPTWSATAHSLHWLLEVRASTSAAPGSAQPIFLLDGTASSSSAALTTTSFAVVSGKVYFLAAAGKQTGVPSTPTATTTHAGWTITPITDPAAETDFNTVAAPARRLCIWVMHGGPTSAAGTVTFTWAQPQSRRSYSIIESPGVDTAQGTAGVIQSVGGVANSGANASATLAAGAQTYNAVLVASCIGSGGNRPDAPGTGYRFAFENIGNTQDIFWQARHMFATGAGVTLDAVDDNAIRALEVASLTGGGASIDVTAIAPQAVPRGNSPSDDLTITGTNFDQTATVAVSGADVTVNGVTWVNATTLIANVTVASSAATGSRTVTVTNADSSSDTGTFTIIKAAWELIADAVDGTAGARTSVDLSQGYSGVVHKWPVTYVVPSRNYLRIHGGTAGVVCRYDTKGGTGFGGSFVADPVPALWMAPYAQGGVADAGARWPKSRQRFRLITCTDILIENLTFRGTHLDTEGYDSAVELQHAVSMNGCTDCVVQFCLGDGVWGDGVYMTGANVRCKNTNNTWRNLGRDPGAIASGVDLEFSYNAIYPPLRSVLDIEPPVGNETIDGVLVTENDIYGYGLNGFPAAGKAAATVNDLTFTNNRFHGVPMKIDLGSDNLITRRQNVTITGNTSDTPFTAENKVPISIQNYGGTIIITNNTQTVASPARALYGLRDVCGSVTASGNTWGATLPEAYVAAPCSTAPSGPSPGTCTPTTLQQGQTGVTVAVAGAFYQFGCTVAFPVGITVNSVTFNDSTSLTLNVTVAAGATLGAYAMTITNPDSQSAVTNNAITVEAAAAPPTITSFSPPSATRGMSSTHVAAGTGFTTQSDVTFVPSDSITVDAVRYLSPTSLEVDLTIAP